MRGRRRMSFNRGRFTWRWSDLGFLASKASFSFRIFSSSDSSCVFFFLISVFFFLSLSSGLHLLVFSSLDSLLYFSTFFISLFLSLPPSSSYSYFYIPSSFPLLHLACFLFLLLFPFLLFFPFPLLPLLLVLPLLLLLPFLLSFSSSSSSFSFPFSSPASPSSRGGESERAQE